MKEYKHLPKWKNIHICQNRIVNLFFKFLILLKICDANLIIIVLLNTNLFFRK